MNREIVSLLGRFIQLVASSGIGRAVTFQCATVLTRTRSLANWQLGGSRKRPPLLQRLTSKTPLDAKELLEAGLDEMRRTIREKEPERPSTRVSTLRGEELTTTAKRRGLDPPKLVNKERVAAQLKYRELIEPLFLRIQSSSTAITPSPIPSPAHGGFIS